MYSKTTVICLLASVLVIHGERHDMGGHGDMRGGQDGMGHPDGMGPPNGAQGDGYVGNGQQGGGFHGRHHDEVELQTIECNPEFECDLPSGHVGTFVCRSHTHPVTGEPISRPRCVRNDHAWGTDKCGCCDEECVQPEFIDLSCDESTQPGNGNGENNGFGGNGGNGQNGGDAGNNGFGGNTTVSRSGNSFENGDRTIVCRVMPNPFTGEDTRVTIPIASGRAFEGDECGCCDGVCPQRGEARFQRPDFVDLSCEGESLIGCDLPPRSGNGHGEEVVEQGLFVVRSLFDPHTGEEQREAICIPGSRAWEGDECGCGNQACPEQPRSVDVQCDAEEDQCQLRSGEPGFFVCRAIFHPYDGQLRNRNMCIPSSGGWVTDVCGCCDPADCPAPPSGDGFPDEETQLLAYASEVPDDSEDEYDAPEDCGDSLIYSYSVLIMFLALSLAW